MELRLSFDRADKVYSAGDIVSCRLHLKVLKEVKCRSISMRFLGIGITEFDVYNVTKRHRCRKVSKAKPYSGYEEYFRHYKYFIGSKGALETIIIPGDYEFSESYELPPNIPANFDGDYGSIKYLVRVKVENNWTTDQMTVDTFNVKPVLNFIQQSASGRCMIEQRNQKYFHSWWLHKKSQPVEMCAALESDIFVIGDTIQLAVNVQNKSNIRIKHFLIKLEQCSAFKGSFNANSTDGSGEKMKSDMNAGDTEIETNEITSMRVLWSRIFPVEVRERKTRDFGAEIPVPAENYVKLLPGSRLMSIEYYLRLVGVVNRFHSDPELIIRFKIATTASDV